MWRTCCEKKSTLNSSVVFKNVKFLRATNTPASKDAAVHLLITVQNDSGNFEITENEQLVVRGTVRNIDDAEVKSKMTHFDFPDKTDSETLVEKDIYKEFRLRGYNYR